MPQDLRQARVRRSSTRKYGPWPMPGVVVERDPLGAHVVAQRLEQRAQEPLAAAAWHRRELD